MATARYTAEPSVNFYLDKFRQTLTHSEVEVAADNGGLNAEEAEVEEQWEEGEVEEEDEEEEGEEEEEAEEEYVEGEEGAHMEAHAEEDYADNFADAFGYDVYGFGQYGPWWDDWARGDWNEWSDWCDWNWGYWNSPKMAYPQFGHPHGNGLFWDDSLQCWMDPWEEYGGETPMAAYDEEILDEEAEDTEAMLGDETPLAGEDQLMEEDSPFVEEILSDDEKQLSEEERQLEEERQFTEEEKLLVGEELVGEERQLVGDERQVAATEEVDMDSIEHKEVNVVVENRTEIAEKREERMDDRPEEEKGEEKKRPADADIEEVSKRAKLEGAEKDDNAVECEERERAEEEDGIKVTFETVDHRLAVIGELEHLAPAVVSKSRDKVGCSVEGCEREWYACDVATGDGPANKYVEHYVIAHILQDEEREMTADVPVPTSGMCRFVQILAPCDMCCGEVTGLYEWNENGHFKRFCHQCHALRSAYPPIMKQ